MRRVPSFAEAPAARFLGAGWLAVLGSFVLTAFLAWSVTHLVALVRGAAGDPQGTLAIAWLVSFLLLWWVPLSWLERPVRATAAQHALLDTLTVTVQVPVHDEDPAVLRACLRSVLAQTRRVDRIRVVDDGSVDGEGRPVAYDGVREGFLGEAAARGIEATWDRTEDRGRRFARMHALAQDDADVFVMLDSGSVLERDAIREGLAPFADPMVKSVAGRVLVLNRTAAPLAVLTCLLYLPFTQGLRSAQSVLRRVTIDSGTLAFYRGEVVRACAGVYENESSRDRPLQMNDDSMLTFYALLAGDTVHQPSAIAFTLVPERLGRYFEQQLRWMRGTAVRHLWWLRYMPLGGVVFWTTVAEYLHLVLALLVTAAVVLVPDYRVMLGTVAAGGIGIGTAMSYLTALRIFTVHRGDESAWFRLALFALAPLASLWRLLLLRPLYLFSVLTCHRADRRDARSGVEVSLGSR